MNMLEKTAKSNGTVPSQFFSDRSAFVGGAIAVSLLTLIQLLNFALTPNPYASVHAGRVNVDDAGVVSEAPALHMAAAMVVSLCCGLLWQALKKRIVFEPWSLLLAGTYTAVSLANGTYDDRPQTALFITFLILASGMLGKSDAKHPAIESSPFAVGLWPTIVLVVFGAALAQVSPGRFGYLSLQGSRDARGEISLWIFTGVHYTPAALVAGMVASRAWENFRLRDRVAALFAAASVLLLHIGGANRNESLSFAIIMLCVLISRPALVSVIGPLLVAFVLLFWSRIYTFFMLEAESDLVDATNGRAELWSYFWDHIGDNPWVGVGEHFIGRVVDYGEGPNSEIGMLAVFTEKGWVFGTLLSVFLVRAFVCAVLLLRARPNPYVCSVAAYVIGLSTKFWIQGGSWPVADLLFWYAVAFLNNYQLPALIRSFGPQREPLRYRGIGTQPSEQRGF